MKRTLKKSLLSVAVCGAVFSASNGAFAQAFPDFVVNESAIAGATGRTLTADKITGNYVEVITFTGSGSGGTLNASLLWNAGQFVANDGSNPVASQLGSVSANEYGLYALYQGTGTFTTTGSVTTFNFTPGGSLRLFADPNSNTTFVQPPNGTTPYTTGNSGDDILIATGTPSSGQGTLDPTLSTCAGGGGAGGGGAGINCGSFGASSSFNLTAEGSSYFTAPNPFYSISFQSGQLNNFSPTGVQVINGSLDVIFGRGQVPEPGTVALFGLGVLALTLTARSRRKAG